MPDIFDAKGAKRVIDWLIVAAVVAAVVVIACLA